MKCPEFVAAARAAIASDHYARVVIVSAWLTYFRPIDGPYARDRFCLRLKDGGCEAGATDAAFEAMIARAYDGLGTMIEEMRRDGTEVVVLGPNLLADRTASYLYRESFLAGRGVTVPPADLAKFRADFAFEIGEVSRVSRTAGAALVDPLPSLCPEQQCPFYDDGRFLFRDAHHVRASEIESPYYAVLDQAVLRR